MKKLLVGLAGIALMLAAAAFWVTPSHPRGADLPFKFSEPGVEFGLMTEVVSANGPLAPREITLVTSMIGGQVDEIYPNADFNRFVDKGEPLFVLDQSLAKVELGQAEAAVDAAKADVTRAEAARDASQKAFDTLMGLSEEIRSKARVEEASYNLSSAKSAVEAALSKLKMAEKLLEKAQIGLDKTVVRAPAAGVIQDKNVYRGQMVGPQAPDPLFKIASDLGELEANAQVAEGDISKIRVGQEAVLNVYAYSEGNTRFDGKVKQIHNLPPKIKGFDGPQGAVFYNTVITVKNRRNPDAQEAGLMMRSQAGGVFASALKGPLAVLPWFQVRPMDDSWMLRPRMTATVDIVLRKHADVWKVPTDALSFSLDDASWTSQAKAKVEQWKKDHQNFDDWKYVWTLDKYGKPWPIFVRVGGKNKTGETGIKDGQAVEVLEWEPEVLAKLDAKDKKTFPRLINQAPPPGKKGLFDRDTRIGP